VYVIVQQEIGLVLPVNSQIKIEIVNSRIRCQLNPNKEHEDL